MNAHERRITFDGLLQKQTPLAAPGAYDSLSALLIQETGFPVIYVGSYATAASSLGLPDVGNLTLDNLTSVAKAVTDAVSLPVIADAEGGFFEAPNIWRTVHGFEDAGVAGIHIEDHAGGKHTDLPQQIIPLEEMLGKLQAALDARRDPAFKIIARTDAIWAMGNPEEAQRRVRAFSYLGVDMIFPTGASPQQAAAFRHECSRPVVVIDGPNHEGFADWNGAADLVLYYGFCLYAATLNIVQALGRFRANPADAAITAMLEPVNVFENRLGYAAFTERARRYNPAYRRENNASN